MKKKRLFVLRHDQPYVPRIRGKLWQRALVSTEPLERPGQKGRYPTLKNQNLTEEDSAVAALEGLVSVIRGQHAVHLKKNDV